MHDMNRIVGTHDILWIILDTLRYDVAVQELASGNLPNLQSVLPAGGWEKRHAPGNFTYSSHQAFFGGFLPSPARPGKHPRLFALRFPGSETTAPETCVFDTSDIVSGLAARGYYTVCIGGVGFFNKQSPLGMVLPGLFRESHWSPEMGVTHRDSARNQVQCALDILNRRKETQRQPVFLFLNISALHQPNRFYLENAKSDSIESHAAALRYVDSQFPPLFHALGKQRPVFCVVCSDHGTAYGEEGYNGHRLGHDVVWTVPYAEFILDRGQHP